MISLAHFPPEILNLIIQAGASHVVVRLYKCGYQLLNTKLEKCITEVSLRQAIASGQKLPRLLSKLPKLRHLSVYSRLSLNTKPYSMLLELVNLPSSLETLELDSEDSPKAFLAHTGVIPSVDPHRPDQGLNPAWPGFANHFPLLTTLKVRTILPENLALFPATLTHLTIRDCPRQKPGFFALLPRSLTVLDCPIEAFGGTFEPLMDEFSLAPHPLRYLAPVEITAPKAIVMPDLDPLQWTSKLPEGISRLILLSRCTPSLLASMPRSLTELDLFDSSDTKWDDFANLYYEDVKALGAKKYRAIWPPNLVQLSITLFTRGERRAEALPRTVTSLKIAVLDREPILAFTLPRQLEELILVLKLPMADKMLQGTLPETLSKLHVLGRSPLDIMTLNALPSHLTYLKFDALVQPKAKGPLPVLPASLVELDAGNWSSAWFNLLPPLTTALSIKRLDIATQTVEELFADLPRGLKRLDIPQTSLTLPKTLPDTCVSHLPLLEALILHKALELPSSTLPLLPRTMAHLDVSLSLIDESDLYSLPPQLLQCSLNIPLEALPVGEFWPLKALRSLPRTHHERSEKTLLQRLKDLDY